MAVHFREPAVGSVDVRVQSIGHRPVEEIVKSEVIKNITQFMNSERGFSLFIHEQCMMHVRVFIQLLYQNSR